RNCLGVTEAERTRRKGCAKECRLAQPFRDSRVNYTPSPDLARQAESQDAVAKRDGVLTLSVSQCLNSCVEAALRAIAEPRRRAILQLVRNQELTAGDIATKFDVSRPAISQHLTVLKSAGLLVERHVGTRRLYRARPEGLAELRAYLDDFWGDHLEM